MSRIRVHPHARNLSASLAAELSYHRHSTLAAAVTRLTTAYRSGDPASSPPLDTAEAALAYATYRMPATHAAVTAALAAAVLKSPTTPGVTAAAPTLEPRTMLDVGGGTGAAVWAAAALFPSLISATVLDRSGPALRLGRALATRAALRVSVTWTRAALTPATTLPPADLMTMAYVLAELPDATAAALVDAVARTAAAVAVVEPGTPAGHRRVLEVRRRLLAQGLHVLAPCPHESDCPLADGDWCHFGARLERTPTHRRIKGGSLGYEDEKFAYVIAARTAPTSRTGRILRRPQHRTGLVQLQVCTPDDAVQRTLVSRRQGALYRAARHSSWGDHWPALDGAAD